MRFQIILPTSAICSVTVISKTVSITYRNPQHVALLGQLDNDYYHLQCDIKPTHTPVSFYALKENENDRIFRHSKKIRLEKWEND